MNDIRERGHVVAIAMTLLSVLFSIVSLCLGGYSSAVYEYLAIATGVVFSIILIIIQLKKSDSIAVELLFIVNCNIVAFVTVLYWSSEYIMFLAFLIQWLVAIPFLRKAVFRFTVVMQTLCCGAILMMPKEVFMARSITLVSIIFIVIFLLAADWVSTTIVNSLLSMDADNTEQARSLDDLLKIVEEKHREAKEATKSKSQFLSSMSHEIRTPINAILGFNEMIARESKERHVLDYSYDIKNSGNMLMSLVNDVLDISKIEEGRMELVAVNVSISSVINDVENMVKQRAEDKGIRLIVNVDKNIPSVYRADDVRLRQILVNLLTNAVKYTHEGSVEFSVTGKSIGEKREQLRFCVRDTGIGIKSEDIARLNEKFVRLDEERNRFIEGSGLGINIVNGLLQLMDSHLEVSSEYGKGSQFYFEVCFDVVDPKPIYEYKSSKPMSKEHSVRFTAPDARVLVVDDSSVNIKVFKVLLKETQISIDAALSGYEAINLSKRNKYDAVFMDHMMPGMDGIETMNKMKSDKESLNRETPYIALTANAVAGAREKYLEVGFDDFITKPVHPEKLEKMVQEYVTVIGATRE